MLSRRRTLRPMKMGPEGREGRKGLMGSLPMAIRGYRRRGGEAGIRLGKGFDRVAMRCRPATKKRVRLK
jgi:hypothetical protein